MIPLRVYVKGFMCYRDAAELQFDGAELWALSGQNGAGKSAIFDAITFALYGVYRGGKKQKFVDLINQQSDSLIVEFDFALGKDIYRAKRTVSHKSKPSYQLIHLEGPSAPYPNKSSSQPVPNTESIKGFNAWIQSRIGIDSETFMASVFLQQGKGDIMLESDPGKRHEMLTQIVDLSAYKQLHQKANEKQKHYRERRKIYEKELVSLENIDEAQIRQLTQQIEASSQNYKNTQEKLKRLAGLKVHASNFFQLNQDKDQLQRNIQKSTDLLNRQDQIKANVSRFKELEEVIPILENLFDYNQRFSECNDLIIRYSKGIERQKDDLMERQNELSKVENELDDLETRRQESQKKRLDLQNQLTELAPQLEEIKRLEGTRTDLQSLTEKFEKFPQDLEQQISAMTNEINRLTALNVALPWLKQFMQARTSWQEAQKLEVKTTDVITDLKQDLHKQTDINLEKQKSLNELEDIISDFQKKVAKTETVVDGIKIQLEKFEEIELLPTCSYCGQELTKEHLNDERSRLDSEYQIARDELTTLQESLSQAINRQDVLKKEIARLNSQINQLQKEIQKSENVIEKSNNDQSIAHRNAKRALQNLPANYKCKINPSSPIDPQLYFQSFYPTEEDLVSLEGQTAHLSENQVNQKRLVDLNNQRHDLLVQSRQVKDQLQKLENRYPLDHIQQKKIKHQTIENDIQKIEQSLKDADHTSVTKRQIRDDLAQKIESAQNNYRTSMSDYQSELTRKEEIEQVISLNRSELPSAWQEDSHSLTKQILERHILEKTDLIDAIKEYETLMDVQRTVEDSKRHLEDIDSKLGQIPSDAKISLTELDKQEAGLEEKLKQLDNERLKLTREEQRLIGEKEQFDDLINKHRQTARKAALYKKLTQLLGPDYLQRRLLQQAEIGIITHANEVLDRISGGILRLALDGHSTGNTTNTKALDIVAYNSEIGQEPLPVILLSGSQRFRVAVSLAIGVGRYVSQASQRIESVIIDEGFGGLDNDGRQVMIDELHRLKGLLSRIILVSHQDEFAQAFPNRYQIKLEGGTSKVQVV